MQNRLKKYYESKTVRHYSRVVAFAVLAVLVGLLVIYGAEKRNLIPSAEEQVVRDSNDGTATTTAYTLPEAEAVRLRVPSADIDTTFEQPLGLNADQTIEVPDSYEQVGWYQYGPTPGELGPAVVLGHVDSFEGPAVFFSLGQLEPGDAIYIDRDDGTTATFTVSHLERHEQSGFPTEKVYSDIDHAGLRLITCSGTYAEDTQRYTHNLIVFAELEEAPTDEHENID